MSNKKQQIPSIRFKGFTDAWERRKLGELCEEFQSGKNIKAEDIKENGAYPVYGGNGLRGYSDTYNHDGVYALVGRQGALCGNMNISFGKAYFTEHAVAVKANISSDTEFLFYLLGKMNLGQYSSQSAQPGLAVNKLIKLSAFVPSRYEQKKISELYVCLDSSITLYQRQLDNYKELQKALLQKIFNQELRFKDNYGDDYPEWKKEKLGNLITEVVKKSTIQDQYPILSSTNKGLFLQSEYFKSNIASDDNIGYKILRKNEIVFSPQNLWMGNINFNDKYEAGIVSPSYKIFSVNDEVVNGFMKFLIKTQYMMNEYVLSSEQGASIVRRNLDMELFNKIKVKIPTIPEQQKITGFLIASDDQIYQVVQKLERLKEQKQGLMQRMFV